MFFAVGMLIKHQCFCCLLFFPLIQQPEKENSFYISNWFTVKHTITSHLLGENYDPSRDNICTGYNSAHSQNVKSKTFCLFVESATITADSIKIIKTLATQSCPCKVFKYLLIKLQD